MAKKKKSRRSRSSNKVKQTSVAQTSDAQAVKIPRRAIDDETFNPDYTPIIQDLKRIGGLAVAFFVVLVALSFIL
jgi:hypothetical protein